MTKLCYYEKNTIIIDISEKLDQPKEKSRKISTTANSVK